MKKPHLVLLATALLSSCVSTPVHKVSAPVSAADMRAVLLLDLEKSLATGFLAPDKPTGVVIGLAQDGHRHVFTLGTAKPDSVFEIGSVTKTFTSLVLAQMIEQGQVKPDTPLRKLLPPGAVKQSPGTVSGAEITLLDLATHRSGLPRMPTNFAPADRGNPYADYGAEQLYQFISSHGVARPEKRSVLYSNVGAGLLGQALADRAGTSWPDLVRTAVLEPLGMRDTAVQLSEDQRLRFMRPYSGDLQPARAWDFTALAGAGGLRSTAGDMLNYLDAQLAGDLLPATSPAARSLPAALKRSHHVIAYMGDNTHVAYGWFFDDKTGAYWHNGATGGFTCSVFFHPEKKYAGIVLVNVANGTSGSFADVLGRHIRRRLDGRPGLPLDAW